MSVLDEMTKGLSASKARAAGPKLTPVGTEASPTKPSLVGIPEVPEVFLTNEAVKDVAFELRRMVGLLLDVAQGLDNLTGLATDRSAEEARSAKVEQAKELERQADEKARKVTTPETQEFAERMKELSAAAQAATFTSADATGGWTCPAHGAEAIHQLTSRKGRVYAACQVAGCGKFEKE